MISSQSDYSTEGILKTEHAYLPTMFYYCITHIKIKTLTENTEQQSLTVELFY